MRSAPKLEDQTLPAAHECFFSIFASISHSRRLPVNAEINIDHCVQSLLYNYQVLLKMLSG